MRTVLNFTLLLLISISSYAQTAFTPQFKLNEPKISLHTQSTDPENPIIEGNFVKRYIGSNIVSGVGLYAWSIPVAFDARDEQAAGMVLLTASASFFIPFLVSKGKEVNYAQYFLGSRNQFMGYADGLLLARAVDAKSGAYPAYGTVFGITENVMGFLIGADKKVTRGGAANVTFNRLNGAHIGTWAGIMIGDKGRLGGESSDKSAALGAFIGSLTGQIVSATRMDKVSYHEGDIGIRYYNAALGSLLAGGFLTNKNNPSAGVAGLAMVTGNVAGTLYGNLLLKKYGHKSKKESAIVFLSTLAGATFGLGTAFTAGLADNPTPEGLIFTTVLGALGGELVGLSVLSDRARKAKNAPKKL